jgi:hypothetical protein
MNYQHTNTNMNMNMNIDSSFDPLSEVGMHVLY